MSATPSPKQPLRLDHPTPNLTRTGRILGAVVAVWLIAAVLAVASTAVIVAIAAILEVSK